jgi:VanZ family protein
MAAIFVESSFSTLPHLPELLSWDKLQHTAAYLLGGVLAAHAVRPSRRWAVLVVAIVSLYGVSDEIHQAFVPGRSSDVFDWVADTTGALLAVALVHLFTSRRGRGSMLPTGAAEPIVE